MPATGSSARASNDGTGATLAPPRAIPRWSLWETMGARVMAGGPPTGERWRFDDYTLDVDRRLLGRGGRWSPLEERTVRVLRCLLRHADAVVSRDTLRNEAWPGQVVTDGAIAKAVMKLRSALGSDADRLLLTLYGAGYRLAVHAVADHPHPPANAIELRPGAPFPPRPAWQFGTRLEDHAGCERWLLLHGKTGETRLLYLAISATQRKRLAAIVAAHAQLARHDPGHAGVLRLHECDADATPAYAEFALDGALPLTSQAPGLQAWSAEERDAFTHACGETLARGHAAGAAHGHFGAQAIFVHVAPGGRAQPRLTGYAIVAADDGSADAAFRDAIERDHEALRRWAGAVAQPVPAPAARATPKAQHDPALRVRFRAQAMLAFAVALLGLVFLWSQARSTPGVTHDAGPSSASAPRQAEP